MPRRPMWLAVFALAIVAIACTLVGDGPGARAADAANAGAAGHAADVIVVGAGIAGLSAALEAAERGAKVRVLDLNSVGGGHAVVAGGFALVDTPLQRRQGITDSPERASADWIGWGESGNEAWIRRYAAESRIEVHDWLAGLGVEFVLLLPSPENSVRRFHFTRGTAVHAVVPMMRAAYAHPRVTFDYNTEATGLIERGGRVVGVSARHMRTGESMTYEADAVIVATGGFESDVDEVREHWLEGVREPERLLAGAGHFATGSGLELAASGGADLAALDRHTIFPNGLPDPRDAGGARGLAATHPDAIWVNVRGRRFVDESADPKRVHDALVAQRPMSYWLIFDAATRSRLRVRDAVWLDAKSVATEILDDSDLTTSADTVAELAVRAGIDADGLEQTISRYNAMLAAGVDEEFGRFDASTRRRPPPLATPPYYALQLYPLTRKSLGGIAIDERMQALDESGSAIPGLYAIGEATGVGGFNGEHGMSGTFLGPSVLMGRIAARSATARAGAEPMQAPGAVPESSATTPAAIPPAAMPPAALATLVDAERPGYWHFERSHALVLERALECNACHSAAFPMSTPVTRAARTARLATCTNCH